MIKIAFIWLLLLVIALSCFNLQAFADNPPNYPSDPPVGTKVKLDKNTTITFLGRDDKGKQTWNAIVNSLPQSDNSGNAIDPSWHMNGLTGFTAGNNLFAATVDNQVVTIKYQNKIMTLDPQIMIGGKLATPNTKIGQLLATDPINPNYQLNTLEWDYGSFIRHVRVIEGEIFQYIIFPKNPKATVALGNEYRDMGYTWEVPVQGWDSKGKSIKVNYDRTIDASEFDRTDLTYPLTIDPTSSFTTSASDGYIWSHWPDVSSAAAWNGAYNGTSKLLDNTNTASYVSVATNGSTYSWDINRAYLYFDTSALNGYTITAASVNIYLFSALTQISAWQLGVQSGQPTYPHDPLVTGDWSNTYYDGNGVHGTLDSSAMSTGAYNAITLDATGQGWINKTGTTKLTLRDNTNDIPASAPAWPGIYKQNIAGFYTYEQGAGYQPYLSVTFSAADPVIVVNAPSDIAKTSTILNATVSSDGGDPTLVQVRFGYGKTSHIAADFNLYTTITSYVTGYSTGSVAQYMATGLDPGATYYYRAQAKNSNGDVITTTSEQTFTTLSGVNNVTGLAAKPSSTQITLTWNKASGASTYTIRYSLVAFPATTADGTLISNDAANTYTQTGLTAGTNYYYSVWGLSGATYSTTPAQLLVTTSAAGATDDSNKYQASPPIGWLTNTNYTNLSGIPFIYDIVNGVADGLGLPYNIAWISFGTVIAVFLGILTFKFGGNSLMGSLAVMLVVFVIEWAVQMTPLYFPMLSVVSIIGTITVKHQFG